MKKLIAVVGLLLCFNIFSQESNPSEGFFKSNLRSFFMKVLGNEWSSKILGETPLLMPEVLLPKIPANFRKITDVQSYSKIKKEFTEFDQLPIERKRYFDYKFIEELFLVTRKTSPKDEDLVNWLNILGQGGSREGIYQALVLDEVYSGLEGMDERSSQRLIDFSLTFSHTFLNQTFNKDSLSKLNLYSLKRIFAEKGLDVLDYYEAHDLDSLYRWYAVFSSFMAKEYEPLMKSVIRKDKSANFHYQWAKNMPIQHIKSEFIIKLHSVMNGL